jgi:cytochrome c
MSDLTVNKFLGAGLAAGLVIAALAVVPPMIFEKKPPAKAGYAITAVEEGGAGEAAPEAPPDWGTVLPTADAAAGEAKATAVCGSCHKFDPAGTNSTGPGLYGVLGRQPGTHPGFAYSDAMKAFGAAHPKWDYQEVFDFIHGPQKYVSGTKMTFAGLKATPDRVNIIAYLHTLGSSLPVPPPNPKAAAAAPAPATPGAAPAAGGGAAKAAAPAPAAPAK